jgi:fructose-1-phosphate kinase PfkB-like protein
VTRGARGAVLAAADGTWEGRLHVRGPYPVGSGDSFLSGLVTGLDAGATLQEALRLGLGAGAANAELAGAGRLDPARARTLAARADVRPI